MILVWDKVLHTTLICYKKYLYFSLLHEDEQRMLIKQMDDMRRGKRNIIDD